MQLYSDIYHEAALSGLPVTDPRQGELFPFEGKPQHVALSLSRPYPGIERAVLVPLGASGSSDQTEDGHAAYLMVGDDGRSVLTDVTTRGRMKDPAAWALCARRLLDAHLSEIFSNAVGIQPPPDCWQTWFSLGQWHLDCSAWTHALVRRLTEQNKHLVTNLRTGRLSDELACLEQAIARKLLSDFVAPQVEWALRGLEPTLFSVLAQRPTLSLRAVSRLLSSSRAYGAEAERNAVQFMRTEPIGLVNLVAFAEQVPGAEILRQALHVGKSLKQPLRSLGVGHAVHRRLLRKCDLGTLHSELPLAGTQWLQLARMLSKLLPAHWPATQEECVELLQLGSLKGPQQASMETLAWAWHPGGESLERWSALDLAAARIHSLATNRVQKFESAEAVRALIVATLPELRGRDLVDLQQALSIANVGLYADLVCQVEGGTLDRSMEQMFGTANHLPLTMQQGGFELTLLGTWKEILEHGNRMENCLRRPRFAASYCLRPAALFALTDSTGAPYTVAVVFREEPGQIWACDLDEIQAAGNRNAPEAVVRVTQELLAALSAVRPPSFSRHQVLFTEWSQRLRLNSGKRTDDDC